MKKSLNRYTIINIGFYGGLVIKAIDALIEFIGGILLIFLSHNWLNRLIQLIALPEIREDPNDIVMNYFIKLGQNFSISSQHSVAIYLLLHGTAKLAVIWLLLKRKLWGYPLAVVMLGLFIAYELYSFMHSLSLLLLILIIIDAAMIAIIILEYKRLKAEKAK
ncbi:MAG: DUF2127 domain-containing protein [Caulobacteraceae bacterium]